MNKMEAVEVLGDLREVFESIIESDPEEDTETNREVVQALEIAVEHLSDSSPHGEE